jgi:hypothetical protein
MPLKKYSSGDPIPLMLVDAELCFPLKISEKLKSTEWAKKSFIKA